MNPTGRAASVMTNISVGSSPAMRGPYSASTDGRSDASPTHHSRTCGWSSQRETSGRSSIVIGRSETVATAQVSRPSTSRCLVKVVHTLQRAGGRRPIRSILFEHAFYRGGPGRTGRLGGGLRCGRLDRRAVSGGAGGGGRDRADRGGGEG